MANADTTLDEPPVKKGRSGLLIGLVLALLVGVGGFFAAFSGIGPFAVITESELESVEPHMLKRDWRHGVCSARSHHH